MKQLIQNCSRHRVAIGYSGSGTTFEAIAKAVKTEKLNLDLALVFADRKCLEVEKAKQFGFSPHIRK